MYSFVLHNLKANQISTFAQYWTLTKQPIDNNYNKIDNRHPIG